MAGFVLTADRGYGSLRMIPRLSKRGIGFIFIMPEHLVRCHPFAGSSHFNVHRFDEEDEESRDDESPNRQGSAGEEDVARSYDRDT